MRLTRHLKGSIAGKELALVYPIMQPSRQRHRLERRANWLRVGIGAIEEGMIHLTEDLIFVGVAQRKIVWVIDGVAAHLQHLAGRWVNRDGAAAMTCLL